MKHLFTIIALLSLASFSQAADNQTARLDLRIQHLGANKPYLFNRLAHATRAGTPFEVSRLSYLLSQPRLQKADGSWIEFSDHFTLVNAGETNGLVSLENVPLGTYKKMEWTLGLPDDINHSEPGTWPANHPLNPAVNNLHWNWQDGYIFLALEGKYRTPKGTMSGFIYHVANAPQLRRVTLHCNIQFRQDTTAEISFNVPSLFDSLDMVRDASSTHSREGDTIAPAIADRASRAFRIVASEDGVVSTTAHQPGAVYPPNTTPVQLQLNRGIPQPRLPLDNPLTKEGIALGEKLFHDKRLSQGGIQDCVSCHFPDVAFSDQGNAFSLGVVEKEGLKNSMALFNLAWHDRFFWDGRAASLREQVLHPIQDPLELNETLENVEAKLQTKEDAALFNAAFGTPEVTIERLALALEQFLMSLTSFDSAFDRGSRGEGAYSESERRGLQLYLTEFDPARGQRGADCFHCHGGLLFTNNRFFNNGLDAQPEIGHAVVTNQDTDRGKFKAPSLRNVAVTGPYMHDGRLETLEEVVEHYNSGVKRSPTLDPNLAKHPPEGLGLTDQEKKDLVAFLKSLTDHQYIRTN